MRFPSVPSLARCFRIGSLRAAAAAAAAAVLWGCVFGGTGTDTDNGVATSGPSYDEKRNLVSFSGLSARVVDGNGAPVGGVLINLYAPGFRPDSGVPHLSPLAAGAKQPKTDADGFARIDLAQAGKFVVEGISQGRTLFFDTLAVPDERAALYTFRTRPAGMFRGKVRLASGMRIDKGAAFIRGTDRWTALDSAGNYDLGLLPVDVGRMAIGLRFTASPVGVREVTQTDTSGKPVSMNDSMSAPVYSCTQLQGDSAKAALGGTQVPASQVDTGSSGTAVTPKLDAAVHSCDSLSRGTVVNVKPMVSDSPATGEKRDSIAIAVIVVKEVSNLQSYSSAPVIVPYSGCVAPAGREQTLFGAQVQATAEGNDLLVRDIADKCLNP